MEYDFNNNNEKQMVKVRILFSLYKNVLNMFIFDQVLFGRLTVVIITSPARHWNEWMHFPP